MDILSCGIAHSKKEKALDTAFRAVHDFGSMTIVTSYMHLTTISNYTTAGRSLSAHEIAAVGVKSSMGRVPPQGRVK